MAKTKLGSNATFTGAGLGLSIYGSHCVAYSGAVTDAASSAADSLMLDFHSGKGYIKAKLQFETDAFVSQVFYLDVQLNGISVFDAIWDHSPDKTLMQSPLRLIIPPNTRVQVYWGLTNDTKNGYAIFTGRIYDAA